MNLLELFSGIGGFYKGFLDAGFKFDHVYFSEVDKHAIANYKYNFKNSKYAGSVIDIRGNDLPKIDIITFGSPCQDFSLAGKRKGLKGERSSLIGEAIRIVGECRPSVFIWENVKGAYSSNRGRDFQAILQAFTNIGGYRLEWQLLNTSWLLPQNRERIYLVGHLDGRSRPGIFPFAENDPVFTFKKRYEPQTNICTTLTTGYGDKRSDTYIIPKIAGTLTAGGNSGGLHSDMTIIPVLTPERKEKRQNGRRFKKPGDDAFTLNCQDRHGILIKSTHYGEHQQDRYYDSTGLMSCIPSHSVEDKIKIYHCNKIRRLTEIECERLQGFPDNWTEYGDYDGVIKNISKTRRYQLTGNAVSVPIVKAIAERLKQCLK